MKWSLQTLCLLCMLALVKEGLSETIEDYICSHKFKGCRINYKSRSCQQEEAHGCTSPFPYDSVYECLQDFHGQSNVCELYKPCENNGLCSPITTDEHRRTFKCECSNTGFYGHRCEIKCPMNLSARDPRTFPCIAI